MVAEQGLTKTAAKSLVDSLLKTIADAAAAGEEVNLPGFGKFTVKALPSRTGHNPSTGAVIEIAASTKISFSAAKALKDKVNL